MSATDQEENAIFIFPIWWDSENSGFRMKSSKWSGVLHPVNQNEELVSKLVFYAQSTRMRSW